jgi:hypothetical protein
MKKLNQRLTLFRNILNYFIYVPLASYVYARLLLARSAAGMIVFVVALYSDTNLTHTETSVCGVR